jgi:hypothetical protein
MSPGVGLSDDSNGSKVRRVSVPATQAALSFR